MSQTERRDELRTILAVRRYDTINNLANELGVSTRTVRRDLIELSLTEAIYTQSGRYGGGVYVLENFTANIKYFNKIETDLFNKIIVYLEHEKNPIFPEDEINTLKNMLISHSKTTR